MPAKKPKRSKSSPRTERGASHLIPGEIAGELGVAIVSGRHPPGSSLLTEVEASLRLGISRTAYREALRILTAKGLVETRPKTGTKVTPRASWHLLDPDVLGWMFKGEPNQSFVQHLFELRSIIDPAAAALAAERRSPTQLARMGHALEEFARHGIHTPEGRCADEAFHAEILRATGNEALMALIDSISAAIRWTVIQTARGNRKWHDPMPDHRALYAAIAESNPERARAAALELVRLALEDTKQSMKR